MRRLLSTLAAALRSKRGAALPEFALVALPFIVVVTGTLDLGYQSYLRANLTGAVEKAARKASVGNLTRAQTVAAIRAEVREILPADYRDDAGAVTVTPESYFNFSAVGGGERITGDTAPVGVYNSTDCYEDRNGNGRYDATGGGGDNLGTADDVVYYTVDISVPRLFPLWDTIGWSRNATARARTLVRNQPYGAQQVVIRCS